MNQQATLSSSLLAKFPVLERVRALPKPILIGASSAGAAYLPANPASPRRSRWPPRLLARGCLPGARRAWILRWRYGWSEPPRNS